jgi:hypothetical protein
MPTIRLASFAVSLLLVAIPAAADVSGRWSVRFTADWTSIPDLTCTLSQKDQRVEGSCKEGGNTDDRGVPLTDGRLDGDQVTWMLRVVVPNGDRWTYAFTGTLDTKGTAIDGIVRLSSQFSAKPGEARFTAAKQ